MLALPTLICALACALTPPVERAAPANQDGRDSIEVLLERQRAQRARELARLSGEVGAYLDAFERAGVPVAPARELELTGRLASLGSEAAVVLVPYLEPGPDPGELQLARGRAVAAALSQVGDISVTDALLELLREGTPPARMNALRSLEHTPEPARVRPVLMDLFDGEDAALRAPVLQTLVRIGGPGNAELFARVLSSSDKALVRLGLQALIDTGDRSAAAQVRELLARPSAASEHVALLLDYYRGGPELLDGDVLGLWVALIPRVPAADLRVAILAELPDVAGSSSVALKRLLEPLTEGGDPSVVEAARIALARLGDRNARREVLRPHDAFIEKNERFGDAYLRRADVLMRMHEWDEAIKDFLTSIKVSRNNSRPSSEAYLGLARAYAKRGKLKDAAEWLRKAPIQMSELRALAEDPDFRELRESRYGKDVWGT